MRKRIVPLLLAAILALTAVFVPQEVLAAANSATAGVVITREGSLNIRSRASTEAPVVATAGKGTYLTLISRSGSWYQVGFGKGQYGYCHADYIKPVSGTSAAVKVNEGSLNVRSGAGTSNPVIGSLYRDEPVVVLSSSGGWSRILYHGTKTGFVSSRYLSGTTQSDKTISLSVPNLKQTDSRWASKTIGSSGKTFAQIGCATTAIAMMESYRTGATVYPDAMSRNLRYTPSGSVYWPSHYVTVTNGSGYLHGVYEQLKQGRPVLFGAKNAYGGQHWVVITGFTGGDANTAANFTIHDPGSNSRTNLQQFLNAYPNFYKFFHY